MQMGFRSPGPYTGEEGKNGKEGEWVARAYPHRRRPIHHGLPTRTMTGMCSSGLYSNPACSMLTIRTEGVVGSRDLATPAECGNLDVDKVGAADSLSGAVMVMVIIDSSSLKKNKKFKTPGRVSMGSAQMGLSTNQRGAWNR